MLGEREPARGCGAGAQRLGQRAQVVRQRADDRDVEERPRRQRAGPLARRRRACARRSRPAPTGCGLRAAAGARARPVRAAGPRGPRRSARAPPSGRAGAGGPRRHPGPGAQPPRRSPRRAPRRGAPPSRRGPRRASARRRARAGRPPAPRASRASGDAPSRARRTRRAVRRGGGVGRRGACGQRESKSPTRLPGTPTAERRPAVSSLRGDCRRGHQEIVKTRVAIHDLHGTPGHLHAPCTSQGDTRQA